MKLIIVLIVTVLLMGGQMMNANNIQAFELKITNMSKIEIFPTVRSTKYKEEFGVVVIGKSKTIGFSPFKLGDKIQISWEEGESYDLSYATIDTSGLSTDGHKVTSVHLIYHGNKKWVLKAFDKNHIEVGSVP